MSTRLEELNEEQKKLTNAARENAKSVVNMTADTNRQTVTDDYNAQISDTEQSYNELFDQNAVQRIINERKIAENMANLGLTDSGLNRTQQTAAQLSYANTNSKLSIEKQKAVDTLARAMNAQLAGIENNRAASLQSIDSSYDQAAASNAASIYNTELEQAAAVEKARIEAINTAAKKQSDDYYKVMAALGNQNYSDEFKQQYINNFKTTYGLTDDQATSMFGYSGMKYTYTDSELESGTATGNDFTTDMVANGTSLYVESGENQQDLLNYVDRIASENDWSYATELKFFNAIKNRTESIRAFSANPTLMQYTLVSQPKNNTYTGDVANTAVVKDQYGVERTIEDVYYMIKRMHAVSEATKAGNPDDWEKYIDNKNVKNAAKKAIAEIQKKVGITKK